MQRDSTTRNLNQITVDEGVVVLSGYGMSVNVDKGFLVLKDGLGIKSRESRFFKATCGIKRLVIHGTHGLISLSALKWLYDIDASLVQLGWDGETVYSSTNSRESISLKRAQYAAVNNGIGLKIAKYLIMQKLNGQSFVIGKYAPRSIYPINDDPLNALNLVTNSWNDVLKAESISKIVEHESVAAKAYWGSLSTIPLQFTKNGTGGVPEHWKSFGTRRSLLNPTTNRNASNPANAMLNYLYALLFAETRFGLLGAGFDPMAGIVHADSQYRDSFAYDMMEALRPEVDYWLLDFIEKHVFTNKDFYEKRDGGIRLTLKITPVLVETIPLWAEKARAVISDVEDILLNNKIQDHKKTS